MDIRKLQKPFYYLTLKKYKLAMNQKGYLVFWKYDKDNNESPALLINLIHNILRAFQGTMDYYKSWKRSNKNK